MDVKTKIVIGAIVVWVLGLLALNRIQAVSGSMYPMLDPVTPNPDYNPDLHELIVYITGGWTFLCIVVALLVGRLVNRQ